MLQLAELVHGLVRVVAAVDARLHVGDLALDLQQFWERGHEEVVHGDVVRELVRLPHVPDLDTAADASLPGLREQRAGDEAQERGFPCPFGPTTPSFSPGFTWKESPSKMRSAA